jgi:hypothetical protein
MYKFYYNQRTYTILNNINRQLLEWPLLEVCVQLVCFCVLSCMYEYCAVGLKIQGFSSAVTLLSAVCAPSSGQNLSLKGRISSWEPIPDKSWFQPDSLQESGPHKSFFLVLQRALLILLLLFQGVPAGIEPAT